MKKKALLLVDLQNDFLPWGALPVEEGDKVIPVANRLMPHFDLVVASQDWHPGNHGSFAANHPWRKPGQVIDLNGLQQVLWPIHCVQDSFGAEFSKDLQLDRIDQVFQKGTDAGVDSYSAFFDNGHKKSTGLGDFLKAAGVETIYIMGLATDYCVKFSALDSVLQHFNTVLITDGCRGVNLEEGDVDKAIQEMTLQGVQLITSEDLLISTGF